MLFQFGRYLLIACSRPGSLPANLQGVWNNSNTPEWHCDYHTNINVQMNYWLAEPANLGECQLPLFDLFTAGIPVHREATRIRFGDVPGFTFQTVYNVFCGTGWEWNMIGSAWIAQHFWEHYAFTQDKDYLRKTAYPFMKQVCEFWEARLKKLPDGRLVVPEGWSPEQGPREDGVSHDQQIVWDLFRNTIEASEALGVDAEFRARLTGNARTPGRPEDRQVGTVAGMDGGSRRSQERPPPHVPPLRRLSGAADLAGANPGIRQGGRRFARGPRRDRRRPPLVDLAVALRDLGAPRRGRQGRVT